MPHPYLTALVCLALFCLWTFITFILGKSEGYWQGWYDRDNDQDCPPRHIRQHDNPPRIPPSRRDT
jgi:hypothetical protein